jgi:hypothetical protein
MRSPAYALVYSVVLGGSSCCVVCLDYECFLIESGVPMKLVRLIKMCLSELYSKVHIYKHLPDNFPIQNGLKKGDALLSLFFKFVLEYAIVKMKTRWDWY